MTNTKTAQILLSYQIDQASANRVRQSFANLEYELGDLRSELSGVGTSAQQGISGLRQRFVQGGAAVESLQSDVENLRAELLRLDDLKVTPVVDVQDGGGTSIRGSNTLNTVDRFGRFGTQIAGGFGNSGLGNVVGLVGDVADSFGTLGVAGGAAALAVGGLSLAINELKRIADEAKAAEEARLAGEIAGEQLGQLTPRERAAQVKALIDQIEARDASIIERQQEIAQLEEQYRGADIARAQEYYGRIAAINEEIGTLQNQNATDLSTLIEIGGQANQKIGAFAADFAAKADLVASTFDKIGKAVDKFGGIQGGLASGTPFNTSQNQLNAALQTTRMDNYLASITQTVQAQEALTKAQNAYDEAVRASGARIAEINAKLQADLSQAEADRQRDLADVAAEAGEQRVKITEDTEKERARIEKQFARSYNQAVGDRDALAAQRAEEQRKDELDQLDERYADQLKSVDDSLKKQNKVIEERYRSQIATINAAANAAVRTEQQAAQARLSALQQGVQAAQVALVNAQQNEYLIRANFYNQSISQATVWANTMQMILSYGLSIPGGTGGGKGTDIPGKAVGGPVTAGRAYVVGERGSEIFVPTTSGTIIPHNAAMNININVAGATMDTIRATSRQQALNAFSRVLDQLGAA